MISEDIFKDNLKWIPTTERLPDKSGRVLITTEAFHKRWLEVAKYDKRKRKFFYDNFEFGDIDYDHVIAWMEAPKIYQEEEDDK